MYFTEVLLVHNKKGIATHPYSKIKIVYSVRLFTLLAYQNKIYSRAGPEVGSRLRLLYIWAGMFVEDVRDMPLSNALYPTRYTTVAYSRFIQQRKDTTTTRTYPRQTVGEFDPKVIA